MADVRNFLVGCTYVSDTELFGKRDYWQPPEDFEKRRKGDCEDFALWTWRQLLTWDTMRDSSVDLLAVMVPVMRGLNILKMVSGSCWNPLDAGWDTPCRDSRRCGTNRGFRFPGMAKRSDTSRTRSRHHKLDGQL
jgi:hypothetical protein